MIHEDARKVLELMFRPGEMVCVSPNKYGYHSVPFEDLYKETVCLQSPNEQFGAEVVKTDTLILAALNPINGYRLDENCYRYRNYLVEMDQGSQDLQLFYVRDQLQMPYSAAIFSGNKSLHFLISLDRDLPSEDAYRHISLWTRAIATMADRNCINPSRSIRIPGAQRPEGKMQTLVEFRGPVKIEEMAVWLNNWPDSKPKKEERVPHIDGEPFDWGRVKPFVFNKLNEGISKETSTKGRNSDWFAIACEFAILGLSYEETTNILSEFFIPERDFKAKEWKIILKSAFKKFGGYK